MYIGVYYRICINNIYVNIGFHTDPVHKIGCAAQCAIGIVEMLREPELKKVSFNTQNLAVARSNLHLLGDVADAVQPQENVGPEPMHRHDLNLAPKIPRIRLGTEGPQGESAVRRLPVGRAAADSCCARSTQQGARSRSTQQGSRSKEHAARSTQLGARTRSTQLGGALRMEGVVAACVVSQRQAEPQTSDRIGIESVLHLDAHPTVPEPVGGRGAKTTAFTAAFTGEVTALLLQLAPQSTVHFMRTLEAATNRFLFSAPGGAVPSSSSAELLPTEVKPYFQIWRDASGSIPPPRSLTLRSGWCQCDAHGGKGRGVCGWCQCDASWGMMWGDDQRGGDRMEMKRGLSAIVTTIGD